MISGHALIDEVETFERLGMKPADALKTATSNAAAALLDPQRARRARGIASRARPCG